MKYFFRLAQTPEEADKAHELVKATYKTAGYIEGELNKLDAVYILCCQQPDSKLVGTACIIPSYQRFNFQDLYQQEITPYLQNGMSRSNIIEVGRFAKEESLYNRKESDLIFMGLQICVQEYMELHQLTGWIAIIKPHLLSSLFDVGFEFETHDVEPRNIHALKEISPSYFDPLDMPKLTVCTRQQTFDVVDKYRKMFVKKGICQFYIKENQEVSGATPAISFLKNSKLNRDKLLPTAHKSVNGQINGHHLNGSLLIQKTKFSEQLCQILGKENCRFEEVDIAYDIENASAIKKEIKGIVFPKNTKEVQEIVKLANKYRVPLYPISTGKNWGLGSKLPVKDGALVVSLSKMNKIIEVNAQHGYAIIEPGVTQGQLYEYLQEHKLPYIFNVTGSGLNTSLIGNSLDRGVGYFSSRVENLTGMEIVLGSGKIIRTGFGHYEQAQTTHLYPHGVGPSIDGLFFQSNYGIVVKAGFELIPKRAVHGAILCGLEREESLPEFIEDLTKLRKLGILQTAIHIANKDRGRIALIPHVMDILVEERELSRSAARELASQLFEKEMRNIWSAIGGVMGTKGHVEESFKQVKKHLSKYGRVTLITAPKLQQLKTVCEKLRFIPLFERKRLVISTLEKAFRLSLGIPSDMALKSVYYPIQEIPENESDPDHSHAGLLFSLPIVPMEGLAVLNVNALTVATFKKWGFTAYITLNMINDKALEGVINLAFDKRDKKKVADAHACIEELNAIFMKKGYILYRTAINQMEQVVLEGDEFWKITKELKRVLDPKNIIAPKRYSLV